MAESRGITENGATAESKNISASILRLREHLLDVWDSIDSLISASRHLAYFDAFSNRPDLDCPPASDRPTCVLEVKRSFLALTDLAGREVDIDHESLKSDSTFDAVILVNGVLADVQKGLFDLGAAIGRDALDKDCSDFCAGDPIAAAAQRVQTAIEQLEELPAVKAFFFSAAIDALILDLSFDEGLALSLDSLRQSRDRIIERSYSASDENGQPHEAISESLVDGDKVAFQQNLGRSIDDEKLQQAYDFIRTHPGKKALAVAKHIQVKESTFLSNYGPALKHRGVKVSRDSGWFLDGQPDRAR